MLKETFTANKETGQLEHWIFTSSSVFPLAKKRRCLWFFHPETLRWRCGASMQLRGRDPKSGVCDRIGQTSQTSGQERLLVGNAGFVAAPGYCLHVWSGLRMVRVSVKVGGVKVDEVVVNKWKIRIHVELCCRIQGSVCGLSDRESLKVFGSIEGSVNGSWSRRYDIIDETNFVPLGKMLVRTKF